MIKEVLLIASRDGLLGSMRKRDAVEVGGEAIAKKHEAARYTAIYEIDSPDVLMSPECRVQGGTFAVASASPRREPGVRDALQRTW